MKTRHIITLMATAFALLLANLMQLSNTNRGELIICRFNQSGDSLTVSEPRVNDRNVGDTLITNPAELSPYGINALRETFFIEKLQTDKMILRTERLTLNLKKF